MGNENKITEMIAKARVALKEIEGYSQERVDFLCREVAIECLKKNNAMRCAKLAVEEGLMGKVEDKFSKIQNKVRGAWRDIKDMKTIGKIEYDPVKRISKYAKPVGVVGALLPCTNCEATPAIKGLFTIKGRNAIIFAPHPRTKKTSCMMAEFMRKALAENDAPVDLVQCIEEPTLELSGQLMRDCDLVVATGGPGMVKAAYSSGSPAYGVGQGNAPVIIDETADLAAAANKVKQSKTFDYATSCSTENSLIVEDSIYDAFIQLLISEGGYLLSQKEKDLLGPVLFPDGEHPNPKLVAQAPEIIAKAASINLPDGKAFFIVEEDGVGQGYPFSGEKLAVVVAVYRYSGGFENALDLVDRLISYQGLGHSCGIHTNNDEHIQALGERAKASRIMVNQPQCLANSGNWYNGMPFTLSLGCGTWGGNIATENIGMKHFLNISWLSEPFEPVKPTDMELFGREID
ncbi:MAG: aldehyde dehydrogenase family protein [Candidatus Atribacteria bacterium]|nr:aldehyde dehydrogenase family protein [Candidatus Atribacteria bacterium]